LIIKVLNLCLMGIKGLAVTPFGLSLSLPSSFYLSVTQLKRLSLSLRLSSFYLSFTHPKGLAYTNTAMPSPINQESRIPFVTLEFIERGNIHPNTDRRNRWYKMNCNRVRAMTTLIIVAAFSCVLAITVSAIIVHKQQTAAAPTLAPRENAILGSIMVGTGGDQPGMVGTGSDQSGEGVVLPSPSKPHMAPRNTAILPSSGRRYMAAPTAKAAAAFQPTGIVPLPSGLPHGAEIPVGPGHTRAQQSPGGVQWPETPNLPGDGKKRGNNVVMRGDMQPLPSGLPHGAEIPAGPEKDRSQAPGGYKWPETPSIPEDKKKNDGERGGKGNELIVIVPLPEVPYKGMPAPAPTRRG
jgi:hypothetical protein